jgi:polyphosphate kinase
MDRNLSRRVEVVFPIDQPDLKMRMIDEILAISLADNVKARVLQPDGTYVRIQLREGETPIRSQQRFIELATESERRHQVPIPDPALVGQAPVVHKVMKRTRQRKPS